MIEIQKTGEKLKGYFPRLLDDHRYNLETPIRIF